MTAFSCKNLVIVFLLLMAAAIDVQASTFNFYQAFPDGGYVKGSFSGEDKYGGDSSINLPAFPSDGNLRTCSGRYCPFPELNEVTKFSIEFGGNRVFNRLNNLPDVGLRSLSGLSYDINNDVINYISFGLCNQSCPQHWGYFFYGKYSLLVVTAGLNPPGYDHLQIESYKPVQTFQTPLPGAFGFFFAGFAPIAGLLRKKCKLCRDGGCFALQV